MDLTVIWNHAKITVPVVGPLTLQHKQDAPDSPFQNSQFGWFWSAPGLDWQHSKHKQIGFAKCINKLDSEFSPAMLGSELIDAVTDEIVNVKKQSYF